MPLTNDTKLLFTLWLYVCLAALPITGLSWLIDWVYRSLSNNNGSFGWRCTRIYFLTASILGLLAFSAFVSYSADAPDGNYLSTADYILIGCLMLATVTVLLAVPYGMVALWLARRKKTSVNTH